MAKKKETTEHVPQKKEKSSSKAPRASWLDAESGAPLIEKYARQLDSFIESMADGKVEAKEITAQEKRLTKLMKEIEPELDHALHEKITLLLCELTAYDLMQTLYLMQESRPKTAFHG